VPRLVLACLAVSAALVAPLAAGAANDETSSAGKRVAAAVTGEITLRAKVHSGSWKKSFSLKLVKLRLTDFQICAIWNHTPGSAFDCTAASRNKLPDGTTLRLEQSPIAKAVRRADSPGWGMLGASPDGALGAILSNLVSGNRKGIFHYRVTLRDRSNKILATSNAFTLRWR
jgi:hypothetical protein